MPGPNMFSMNAASGGQFGQNIRQQFGNQSQGQFGPAALLPIGLSIGGALLGAGGDKSMDWGQIQNMFGAQGMADDTQNFMRMLMQTPAFRNMQQSASNQGNAFQRRLGQNIGASGLGGTPMAGITKAASLGYGDQLQRQGSQQFLMQAMRQAMQNRQMQMQMMMQQQQMPSFGSQLGGAMLGAGAQGFSGLFG